MAINTGRVIGGGLLAGLTMNVVDFLGNGVWLAQRWKDEAGALNPRLVDPALEWRAIAGFVTSDFLYGLLLVWGYAAMRPRFGPGVGTAVKASLFVWAIATIAYASYVFTSLYSSGLVVTSTVIGLVAVVAGGIAGAWLYKE